MTEKTEGKRIKIAYAGRRQYPDGSGSFVYYDLETEEKIVFSSRLVGWSSIGGVLEVTRNGSFFKRPCKPEGSLNSKDKMYDQVEEWSVLDRAAKEEAEAIRVVRKGSDNTIDAMLAKIVEHTRYMKQSDRSHIARYCYERILARK